uniref:Uncharacterized protein n=1 Tax=Candidatus Kentrum sp. LFY TaxID=2126342 RepID=A0A450UQ76_9GAMM|nr:MAG: hypothetical protein BECKLFY1418A_GA0070994_104313 [Candidatus Kentron sp. LFY]
MLVDFDVEMNGSPLRGQGGKVTELNLFLYLSENGPIHIDEDSRMISPEKQSRCGMVPW